MARFGLLGAEGVGVGEEAVDRAMSMEGRAEEVGVVAMAWEEWVRRKGREGSRGEAIVDILLDEISGPVMCSGVETVSFV